MARSKGLVNILANFDEVAQFIGSGQGLAEQMQTPYYIDDLLRAVHGEAARMFDKDTAVAAVATQRLGHMYEWGTAGINPAPGIPRIPPTSKAAKLWHHRLTGGTSAHKGIDFVFRPSVVPVPLPTPRTSGIQRKNVGKWPSRRHTFHARPVISESGAIVTIKPKYAKALFIPLMGKPRTSDPRAIKNNYIMTTKAVRVQPGAHLAGNFTAHWLGWWNVTGRVEMTTEAEKAVNLDVNTVIKTKGLRAYKRGVQTKPFSLVVETEKAKASALMRIRSKDRRVREQVERNMNRI